MKDTIIVTGSHGLVGSSAVTKFHGEGFRVVGIDNNMREQYFGKEASTLASGKLLEANLQSYSHFSIDIRDESAVGNILRTEGDRVAAIIHTAAQPAHEWATAHPVIDFEVNAVSTLTLLQHYRNYCPESVFVFLSTNRVYGDWPNRFDYVETETRWTPGADHPYTNGFDESLGIDQVTHSLFGVSKLAADMAVQEYGRYFGLPTVALRGGCLTGPGHKGTKLHGFLSFLLKSAVDRQPYTIYGHGGKQVRDNLESSDVASAIFEIVASGVSSPGEVYNLGGEEDNLSLLEAIEILRERHGLATNFSVSDIGRPSDHAWFVTDMTKFRSHFPRWTKRSNLEEIIDKMVWALQR